MTLQAALAEVLLVGLPVLLLGVGILACAYYVIRPRTLAKTDRLIEELVAESLDQLIAQLREVQTLSVPHATSMSLAPARAASIVPESSALPVSEADAPAIAPHAFGFLQGPSLALAVRQLFGEGLSDRSIARRLGVGIEEVRAARRSGVASRFAA